jgi:hypothetical protein
MQRSFVMLSDTAYPKLFAAACSARFLQTNLAFFNFCNQCSSASFFTITEALIVLD